MRNPQRYRQGNQLLLSRWDAFTRFLDDGRLCISNNAAERELRAVAMRRRNWTFAGFDEGGRRAAVIYTLIATAELNDIDPQAWLADVLARLPDHPARRISPTAALELAPSEHCSRRLSAIRYPPKGRPDQGRCRMLALLMVEPNEPSMVGVAVGVEAFQTVACWPTTVPVGDKIL